MSESLNNKKQMLEPEHPPTPKTPNTVTSDVTSSNYTGNDADGSDGSEIDDGIVREQDRLLPIANVSRIMKQAIPQTAKISKDAKECVQECVSEFIAFVTSEACDRCAQEKRKTINGEDIIWAMEALGFEQYAHVMKIYLSKYKEVTKVDKGAFRSSEVGVYDPSMVTPATAEHDHNDTAVFNNPQL